MNAHLYLRMVDPRITPVLHGRLRQAALPAFLQFLSASRHSGSLRLEGPNEEAGVVVLVSGRVVHAACDSPAGRIVGVEAVRELLVWAHAHVEVNDGLPPKVPNTVKTSVEHVLLEASRLEDEARRQRDELRDHGVVRARNNLAAYDQLDSAAIAVMRKIKKLERERAAVSAAALRSALPDLPVTEILDALANRGLVEFEGVPRGAETASFSILSSVVPVRRARKEAVTGGWESSERSESGDPLSVVEALSDGERTAEDIRAMLRVSPGRMRAYLRALRAAGRVECVDGPVQV